MGTLQLMTDPKDDENSAEPSPIQKPNQPKKTKGGGES